MELKEALQQKQVTGIYAAVISIIKDNKSKNGKIFHVLEVTDSISKAKIYLWADTCNFKPKTFICFSGAVVHTETSFFSSQESQIRVVERGDLPACEPCVTAIFKYETDIKRFSEDIKEFVDCHVTNLSFRELIYQISSVDFLLKIASAPAGRHSHHSLEGGLVKHMHEMFQLYSGIADTTVCHFLRHEFIIIGILLHDYFKFSEYEEVEGEFKMTIQGILLGHIYQGANFLRNLMLKLQKEYEFIEFSDLDMQKAVHVLLAHHGQLDWGSPVVPAIPEAAVLHYIDQISAKCNMFLTANDMEFNKFLGTTVIK